MKELSTTKKKWTIEELYLNLENQLESDAEYIEHHMKENSEYIYGRMMNIRNVLEALESMINIPKLPLLTEEECEFLKWFPQDWWIAKDADECVFAYQIKPHKSGAEWSWGNRSKLVNIEYHPPFNGIKWEDDDCYTIQELLDNYKKTKGMK